MFLSDNGFSSNYVVGLPLSKSPSNSFRFYRKNEHNEKTAIELDTGGRDVLLEVRPAVGEPWVGHFKGGPEGLSAVLPTPNSNVVCVIIDGQGYWVPVDDPKSYMVIDAVPIKRVITIDTKQLLIFVDFTRLTAYDEKGFSWTTNDLSWDGLDIKLITDDQIQGVGWDAAIGEEVKFCVNTLSGESEGGSSPEMYRAGLRGV